MKKILALAALGLAVSAVIAAAITAPVQRWVSDPIVWRITNSSTIQYPGALDSSVVRHGTVAAGGYISSTGLDTSLAIPLQRWELNTSWAGGQTAIDTLIVASINLYPTANTNFTAGTGDSLALALQVSMDGITWSKAQPTVGGFAAGSLVVDGSTQQIFNLSPPAAGTKGFTVNLFQVVDVAGRTTVATGVTSPSWNQLLGWKYLRVIISSNRLNGEWAGWVNYWSSLQYQQQ